MSVIFAVGNSEGWGFFPLLFPFFQFQNIPAIVLYPLSSVLCYTFLYGYQDVCLVKLRKLSKLPEIA